ncbi:ABC transporter [Ceratobasidium sp. AG-Ba]|nr:ABC transporter [Ceratobasidium sp. AG-Ba]
MNFCSNDNAFGPGAACRSLDFTVYFEHSILSITPDAIFLATAIARIIYLRRKPSVLDRPGHAHLGAKILSALLVTATAAATLGLLVSHHTFQLPHITIVSAALSLGSAVVLGLLTWLEHFRNLRPSTLIMSYGLLKGLFGAAILLYARYQRHLPAYKSYSKESRSSVWTRSSFVWLLPLLWRGRTVKFGLDDLSDIPEQFKARESREPLEAALKNSKSLMHATVKSCAGLILGPILPRLALALATFAQPLLVQDLLAFVQDKNRPAQEGWALVGGFVCVYAVMTLSTAVYWEKVYAMVVKYRGGLVGVIYNKSLRLSAHESRTIGAGTASTYMSVDLERISEGIEYFHEIWASILSIGLGLVLLYSQAKWAAFMPLAVIVVTLSVASLAGSGLGKSQTAWLASTDRRIKLISSIISNLMPIKMSAYEKKLEEKVARYREEEMKGTYAGLVSKDPTIGSFDAVSIFTILTTVQILSSPLNFLGQSFPGLFAAYASLQRINVFLMMEEKQPLQVISKKDADEKPSGVVHLDHASFAWDKTSKLVLHDITFTLRPGMLYMCVGSVASGKSSLMASMLGELTLLNGTIATSVRELRIAYASQDAFIFPGTLRDNVLLDSAFDGARYNAVINACGLMPDIARLVKGDGTVLGDKGATLSGGQRQRVALARAVYADAPVLFLDDPFSALDAETEVHVFNSLLGQSGLLRGKTIFVITHNINHLSNADIVVAMKEGKIASEGTVEQLRTSGFDLAHLIKPVDALDASEPAEAVPVDNRSVKNELIARDEEDVNTNDANEEAQNSYNSKGWHPYLFWAHHGGNHRVVISLTFCLSWTVIGLGQSGYAKEWSESEGNTNAWIGGYVAFSLASLVLACLAVWHWCRIIAVGASTSMHKQELKAVMKASPGYLHKTPAGRIINRFSQDMNAVIMLFPLALVNVFTQASSIVGSMILVYVATPWLTISAPVLVGFYWLLLKFYLATSTQLQQLESASKSPLYTTFGTTIAGLETIRAYGVQTHFGGRNDKYLNASQGPFHYRFAGMRFLRASLTLVTLFIAVGMSCLAVGLRSTTSAGFLGIALANMTRISQLLSFMLMSWADAENGAVAVERVHEIATLDPEPDRGRLRIDSSKQAWPVHGSIVFDHYSMRYSEDLPPALRGLSFRIKGGIRVGICGRTGSGKTSTINALFRTVDSSLVNGKLLVDGIDINELPLETLRSSLSIVPQEPFLWHSTIRENLNLDEVCSDDEIWGALERVGMKQAVVALEQKLDTVLEDSTSFSRGERQLLCMARVLLRKRKIVILDEASSSMDLKTDEKVRQIVQEELKDCTVLAVAHRIATIVDFDLIIILDNGEIVETGAPHDLLADSDSRFAKLANSQGIFHKK